MISHQGHYIPTCQLTPAGEDTCPGDHWHGAGWGFPAIAARAASSGDQTTTDLMFFVQPDPDCGFGTVADKPEMTFLLGGQLACDLLATGVSCVGF